MFVTLLLVHISSVTECKHFCEFSEFLQSEVRLTDSCHTHPGHTTLIRLRQQLLCRICPSKFKLGFIKQICFIAVQPGSSFQQKEKNNEVINSFTLINLLRRPSAFFFPVPVTVSAFSGG